MIKAIQLGKQRSLHTLKGASSKNTKNLKNVWIDADQPDHHDVEELKKHTGFDTFELTRLLDEEEKPYVHEEKNCVIIVFKSPYQHDEVTVTSFAIILTKHAIVTIHKKHIHAIEDVRSRLLQHTLTCTTTLEVLNAILVSIAKHYGKSIDVVEQQIDTFEETIQNEKNIIQDIFTTKKTLTYFQKSLKANKEIITVLLDPEVIQDHKELVYIYQDYTQLLDAVEIAKALLDDLSQLNETSATNRLNASMKRMTVYATLISVPTLIASIYGMNFVYMPELEWRYGYVFSLALMVGAIGFGAWLFKVKKWD